ncbi:MAG: 7-carboxy-7-deazaguanine synthase QueE [Mariniblastus sp.]
MLISEIYQSKQGEGLLTGTPSVFVRTSGCNLRCSFCDTPFASWEPEGENLTVERIVQSVVAASKPGGSELSDQEPAKHVVLTGGEPMLPRDIDQLCGQLGGLGFHITIETAGTIHRQLNCDLISVSPKFSNSDPYQSRAGVWREKHQATRHRPKIVQSLISDYQYQLKFVVDTPADLPEILKYLTGINSVDPARVLLMPQGIELGELKSKEYWLIPWAREHGFRFCPRRHIEWYGNKRGT